MLHPDQFHVDKAWIAFKLNVEPIRTGADGNFDCVALMDAASCFILSTAMTSASEPGPSAFEARRLFKAAYAHNRKWPQALLLATSYPAEGLALEAERLKVSVSRVAETQLLPFVADARIGFQEHIAKRNSQ